MRREKEKRKKAGREPPLSAESWGGGKWSRCGRVLERREPGSGSLAIAVSAWGKGDNCPQRRAPEVRKKLYWRFGGEVVQDGRVKVRKIRF